MLQLLGRVLLMVFLCGIIIACEKEEINPETYQEDVSIQYNSFELEISNLVNKHRAELGLPKLILFNLISKEAEPHSIYMLEHAGISHDNFEVRTQDLMENAGALSIAENVGFGYKTAAEVLQGWLNSPSHRSNIENKNSTDFGISAKKNTQGNYYITQIFIKRN